MIDHLLGRPSAGWQRTVVVAFTLASIALMRTHGFEPPLAFLRRWNRALSRMPPWKLVLATLTASYVANHGMLLLFMNAPEPLSRMYTRNFYRATWILTALDAGFMSAMHVRPKFLRDLLSVVFSVMYLFYAQAADEKVRKFRAVASIDVMRLSWNKTMINPYLSLVTLADRGFLRTRRDIKIPRPTPPSPSSFPGRHLDDVPARLYFAGTKRELRRATTVLLDFPGGGFVAMPPRVHDDYLSTWARQTGAPVVSIDYGKAPEHPYPWALEQCFDAYRAIADSNGAVLGLEGWYNTDDVGRLRSRKEPVKIVLVGDSAGGNFAAGVALKILTARGFRVPRPAGLILIYPCLDFNLRSWMQPKERALFRAESKRDVTCTPSLVELHTTVHQNVPLAVPAAPRAVNVLRNQVDRRGSWYRVFSTRAADPGPPIPSSLSYTSRMSYFADRLLPPELLRGMALLYLGQSPRSIHFDTDHFLSPIVAPDELLAQFPRTFLICGEKDPLIDDMIIFAGRLRRAKQRAREAWERLRDARRRERERGAGPAGEEEDDDDDDAGVTFSRRDGGSSSPSDGTSPTSPAAAAAPPLPDGADAHLARHIFARDPDAMVRVKILEGMSHAVLQMCAILPEARQTAAVLGDWCAEMFEDEGGHAADEPLATGDQDAEDITRAALALWDGPDAKPAPAPTPRAAPTPTHAPVAWRADPPQAPGRSPPRPALGAFADTTPQELIELSGRRSGAGSPARSASPSPAAAARSRAGTAATAPRFISSVTEKNFLDRRNADIASVYEIKK